MCACSHTVRTLWYINFVGCKVAFLSIPQEEVTLAGNPYTVQQVLHCDAIYMYLTGDSNNT